MNGWHINNLLQGPSLALWLAYGIVLALIFGLALSFKGSLQV